MIANSRCMGIVKEYEDVLVGYKNALPTIYFSEKSNKKTTIDFLTYVFEGLLGWGKEDVRDRLNATVIKKLRLERAINSLEFPPELDPASDFWYIACLLYPDDIRYDKDRHAVATYEKVLSGRLPRFPKWFFSDFDGEVNAALCLNYALSRFYPTKKIKDLYELFASPKSTAFLYEVQLMQPCTHYFDSPLDMLHHSLCDEEKDEYCYYRLKLKRSLEEAGFSSKLKPVSSYGGMKFKYTTMKNAFEESFNTTVDEMENVL